MTAFPHLHVRSVYAPLQGMCGIAALVDAQASTGSVAVTDPNLWVVAKLCKAASAHAAPPRAIYGLELQLSDLPGHVVVIARNDYGWRNLRAVASMGHASLSELVKRRLLGGCALLTGGASGALLAAIRTGSGSEILELMSDACAAHTENVPGVDTSARLYVELSPTMGDEWRACWELSIESDADVIATGDVSYLSRSHVGSHGVLRCIAEKRNVRDRAAGVVPSLTWGHLASAEEMAEFFAECPAAIDAARELAAECHVDLGLGKIALPDYVASDGRILDEKEQVRELRSLTRAGFEERWQESGRAIHSSVESMTEYLSQVERLDYELRVIEETGFSGYFLIVADFCRWARRSGVPLGPGRGSAAGSLVVYSVGITDVDPIEYGLLFERFLNAERAGGMPDIDVDICKRKRRLVVDYLRSRYGAESVGRIATYTTLGGKSVLKDVGRVLGIGFRELNAALAGAPAIVDGKTPTLEWLVKNVPALREALADPTTDAAKRLAEAIRHGLALEGCIRQIGVHASGVVVSRGPLVNWVPTCVTDDGELSSQWAMEEVEAGGLVKFDLLGLSTVTHLSIAESMVRRRNETSQAKDGGGRSAAFSLDAIPLDDARTLRLCAKGDTLGVFQLCKGGMRRMLQQLRPDRFDDIPAACALYRPGPLKSGMTRDYVERKNGRQIAQSLHALIDPVTAPTYHTIVYQEQVMAAVRIVAGYSLGQADIIRKIMGKKKPEMLAKERKKYLAAAAKVAVVDQATADRVWEVVEAASGYSFNKSHSVCYAMLSYRTAWLKVHYPAEFYASWLSILIDEADSTKKIAEAVYDARAHGVEVLAPDVQTSERDFSVDGDGAVRYGLGALRGLGKKAVAEIVGQRPFASVADFFRRVDVNKRDTIALVGSGALDSLSPRRSLIPSIEALVKWGRTERKSTASGQMPLFG